MCSLVSVFCSRHFSVKQLKFGIYIIFFHHSYHNVLFASKNKAKFPSSSYGKDLKKSVRYGKYATLNMFLFLQLIG